MKGTSALLLLAVVVAVAADHCPTEQSIDWSIELLLRHQDCDKFYKCTYGEPVEQQCPAGLWFNLENYQCDWTFNVDCSDRNVPGEDTKPEPEVEEPEVKEPEVVEPEVEEPEVKEPEVVEPEVEEPEVKEPEVVEPEVEEPEVVEPEVVPEEDNESEAEQEIEFLDNGCPVKPHVHWLLPHEYDCNLFYYCVWGEKVQRQCPSSLSFNRVLQVCDWPQDAGCPATLNKHFSARDVLRGIAM